MDINIELFNKINSLVIENKNLIQELQIYDCCSDSFIKEIEYLKYKLDMNNIIY